MLDISYSLQDVRVDGASSSTRAICLRGVRPLISPMLNDSVQVKTGVLT